ncbi:MAG: ATP-binding protein [Nannocystis sp.]|nr:ATP-binding protein [Nannocystis sp.]
MTWRERFGMHTAPLPAAPRARPSSSATRTISGSRALLLARHRAWPQSPHRRAWRPANRPRSATSAAPSTPTSTASSTSDCAVKPLDLYRMLAAELGLRPSARADRRRHQTRLVTLVDERGIVPVVVLDEAQGLRDELLHELHGLYQPRLRRPRLPHPLARRPPPRAGACASSSTPRSPSASSSTSHSSPGPTYLSLETCSITASPT